MTHSSIAARLIFLATLAASLALPGSAQCLEWSEDFGLPGIDGQANAFATWDDGSGPALFIGGRFEAAGPLKATNVVRYDGEQFTPLANGVPDPNKFGANAIEDLLVFDDGTGEALYAGGVLAGGPDVVRWDGSSWSGVGTSTPKDVTSLAAFDGGGGPTLYAGSDAFGGVTLKRLNGTGWEQIPAWGIGNGGTVEDLEVYDDGTGPSLYACGSFTINNGYPADRITRYDGTIFYQLPPVSLSPGLVLDMEVHDDGSGAKLYVGSSNTVYCWDGIQWGTAGAGLTHGSFELHSFDGVAGGGPELYVGGSSNPGGTVSRLEGSFWNSLGGGSSIRGLGSFDAGNGPELYVGGFSTSANSAWASGVSRFDGSSWNPLTAGAGSQDDVTKAVVFDDGQGPRLIAGVVRDSGVNQAMAWDGQSWTALGAAANGSVFDFAVLDDGSGTKLFASGSFTQIGGVSANGLASWDGTAWQAVGPGVAGIGDLTVWNRPGGAALVLSGSFTSVGGVPTSGVAVWNGSSFETFGSGANGLVRDICTYDSGSGEELYLGGWFTSASGVTVNNVARWDGSAWSSVGGGTDDSIFDLFVHDDGSGSKLYAAGPFTTAGGQAAAYLAAWDGSTWSAVGNGDELPQKVTAGVAFDDGGGESLWVASTGTDPGSLHTWDGVSWETPSLPGFSGGLSNSSVSTLIPFDDGAGTPSLFALGSFKFLGNLASYRIARLDRSCGCPPVTYCTAKVNSLGCTPQIGWDGTYASLSQPSGFSITATQELDNKTGLFFYGYAPKATPYQGGYLCIQAPAKRTSLQNSGGTPPCGGTFSFDFNAHLAAGVDQNLAAGTTVYGQYWSRDPQSSFNTNRTDAIEFVICP